MGLKNSHLRSSNAQFNSFNQLAGSYEEPSNDLITEYYECLIDCDDDQHI